MNMRFFLYLDYLLISSKFIFWKLKPFIAFASESFLSRSDFMAFNSSMVSPDIMLMCHKVTHKNLIDSSPLFRYCLTHASCNFFVKTIDSDTSKEI